MEKKTMQKIDKAVEIKLNSSELPTLLAVQEFAMQISMNPVVTFLSLEDIQFDISEILKPIIYHKTLTRVFISIL